MGNPALASRACWRDAVSMSFYDRRDAGRRLAARLAGFREVAPIVVGLPRGGVVVASEVAEALGAPLDIVVVRKLGAPGRPELGIGAIGEGGVRALNVDLIEMLGVTEREIADVEERENAELSRRVEAFRSGRPPVPVEGRTVLLIDDGLATGYTARAAVRVLRNRNAGRVILAVPVSARDTALALAEEADEVITLELPYGFGAVGQWYADFRQTSDEEVVQLLAGAVSAGTELNLTIPTDAGLLPGELAVPVGATGIVVFAHGSGSSRLSPRNKAVAGCLREAGLGTLLFDLLTDTEAANRANVFDVPLLAGRLTAAADYLATRPEASGLPVGFFGASTGAAAALWAAADIPVKAVVSRGGRPDLAEARLAELVVPTLLIVGGNDLQVLDLNRQAAELMVRAETSLAVVPGAGHLFEEPGALEQVAKLAADWFARWLSATPG